MRAIIVEDEEIDRLNLKTLLEDHPDVEIAGEADSLESAAALIEREKPDAVFLAAAKVGGVPGLSMDGRLVVCMPQGAAA